MYCESRIRTSEPAQEFDKFGPLPYRALVSLFRAQKIRLCRMQHERIVRLVVRQIGNGAIAGKEAVPDANARVIHQFRATRTFPIWKSMASSFLISILPGKSYNLTGKKGVAIWPLRISRRPESAPS